MKYAMLPTPWEETLQVLDAAGHERAPLEEAEVLIFNGGPDDFPQPLPPNVGLVQVPFAGVDHLLGVMRDTTARWSNPQGFMMPPWLNPPLHFYSRSCMRISAWGLAGITAMRWRPIPASFLKIRL